MRSSVCDQYGCAHQTTLTGSKLRRAAKMSMVPNVIMGAISKATSFRAGVEDFWMHGQVCRRPTTQLDLVKTQLGDPASASSSDCFAWHGQTLMANRIIPVQNVCVFL